MDNTNVGSSYSVTGSILARKLKVGVVLPDEEDRGMLMNHLKRMGCQVQGFWPVPKRLPTFADLIFLYLQPKVRDPYEGWKWAENIPLVAVLPYESPSFIDYALKLGAQAVLVTPIRPSGILSAIVISMQRFRESRRQADHIKKLELKLKGVMQLAEAKAILMQMYKIHEADAYEILRSQAMSKRITVEEMSQSIIQANDVFSSTAPSPSGISFMRPIIEVKRRS